MLKLRRSIPVLILAAFLCLALCSCFFGDMAREAGESDFYAFGEDTVPSVKSVVGSRSVTNVSTSVNIGNTVKEYGYRSDTVYEDLTVYAQHLSDNGWMITQDAQGDEIAGSIQIAKPSVDEGMILVMDIVYNGKDFTLTMSKLPGTLESETDAVWEE